MDGITDTRGPIASIALPRDRILYCFHVVSAFVGLDYWIDSVRYEPALPFAIRALLRPEGDSQ